VEAETLRLLGPPAVLEGNAIVPLPTDLRTALIGVLARHDAPVSRGRLAALFWPDTTERAARQNLRQLLHRTRSLLRPAAIDATSTNVLLRCDHDLRRLQAAIAARDAVAAASLAAAPLLEGLELVTNREWQAWLALERSQLVEAARRLLLEAASEWSQVGPPPAAVTVLASWVDRDWFDDELQTAYLQSARLVPGEAQSAAARLARVSAFLEREVGAGLAESVVLASTWLGERTAAQASSLPARKAPTPTLLRPAQPGPEPGKGARTQAPPTRSLLGREPDLRRLDEAVTDRSVRVVTVHGPGGIGKTRLVEAWAAAGGAAGSTGAPLPVVGLAGARDVHDAARLLAQAHGWQVGDVDAVGQLAERLAGHQHVIVLDEVEGHAFVRDWVTALLGAAPGLTLVITSRELIGVEGEQVLRLSGLPLPEDDSAPTVASAPAVRLFLRAARAVRPDLDLGPDELAAVARFARRVDGSPFALTVAATWLQLGPPSALLESVLEDRDDPLAIADVVGPSWSRLEPRERAALEALGVFPGRFEIEAALAVAACSRHTLRRLVDRSLVQPGTTEGLALHALVRHHAARRLAADRDAEEQARERHARYVAERHSRLARSLWHGPGQWHAYTTILAQIQDLRQAWSWACEHEAAELLDGLADAVWCLEIRGWYRLGVELTEAAVGALEGVAAAGDRRGELTLARMLARRGIFAQRLGDVATTRATAEAARAIFERQRARVDPFVYFHLGIAAHFDGDIAAAEDWHHRLVAEAEAAGDAWAAAGGIGNLSLLARERGDLGEACTRGRRAFDAAAALEDGWLIAIAATNLAAMLAERGGSDAEATELAESAIAWAERYVMEALLVEASVTLGQLHERCGRDPDAEAVYVRALSLLDAGVLAGARSPEHGASEDRFRRTIESGLLRLRAEPG
jgi:DNA-binding SARP family transcriptional activator